MKRLFALVAMLGVFLLTPQSNASDLEKLYPEQLNAAKNLYQLTHAYFNGTGKLTEDNLLSPEMVKSRLRQAQFYHLWRLIALAVDAGYDLSDLQEFGIELNGPGFTIDLKKHPQWAKMSSLFRPISEVGDFEYHAQKLRNIGLSEFDVLVLKNYVTSNNPEQMKLRGEIDLVQNFSSANSRNIGKENLESRQVIALHESVRKLREDSWFKWSTELLNQFDEQRQRVILSYLQQRLGLVAVGPQPMDMKYLEYYGKEVISGRKSAQLNSLISQYAKQHSKEEK